jgi:hypothetical protein
MKISWKRTLIWTGASIVMFAIPITFVFAPFAAMTAVCYLSASVAETISKNVKSSIPYSIAAVLQAIIVTLWLCSDIDPARSDGFEVTGALTLIAVYDLFLLVMAAVVYRNGRKEEKNEERFYE